MWLNLAPARLGRLWRSFTFTLPPESGPNSAILLNILQEGEAAGSEPAVSRRHRPAGWARAEATRPQRPPTVAPLFPLLAPGRSDPPLTSLFHQSSSHTQKSEGCVSTYRRNFTSSPEWRTSPTWRTRDRLIHLPHQHGGPRPRRISTSLPLQHSAFTLASFLHQHGRCAFASFHLTPTPTRLTLLCPHSTLFPH